MSVEALFAWFKASPTPGPIIGDDYIESSDNDPPVIPRGPAQPIVEFNTTDF